MVLKKLEKISKGTVASSSTTTTRTRHFFFGSPTAMMLFAVVFLQVLPAHSVMMYGIYRIFPANLADERFSPLNSNDADRRISIEQVPKELKIARHLAVGKRSPFGLSRFLDAYFSPTLSRRRRVATTVDELLGHPRHVRFDGAESPKMAFQRTGGTILLGKRRFALDKTVVADAMPEADDAEPEADWGVPEADEKPATKKPKIRLTPSPPLLRLMFLGDGEPKWTTPKVMNSRAARPLVIKL